MAKMWAGRFQKEEDAAVNDFNSSISFDSRLFQEDVEGSIAHAAMLGETGIIPIEDSQKIILGLEGILKDIKSGKLEFSKDAEDIHMFVEEELTKRIGDAGKKLHTARSRNDQVALDTHIYVKTVCKNTQKQLLELIETLVGIAKKNQDAIMPGYTHLQRAQPISFAHCMLAYANMFRRDIDRLDGCFARADVMPLGSAALAGTTYPINRRAVADKLGFEKVSANSLDGVSDRDFVIEYIFDASLTMMHLSRFAEEVILWASSEFKFVELDDAYATGSSIMPQKKNPDVAELVRGKTGRVYGDLVGMLTVMKGLPLAYNKDMQEDKEALFDCVDTLDVCLPIFTKMLATLTVKKDNMKKAAEKGFINATDVADYLAKKGVPFRDAYKCSGKLVAECISLNTTLNALPLENYKKENPLFEQDVYEAVDLVNCLEKRSSEGGPSSQSVQNQIAEFEKYFNVD